MLLGYKFAWTGLKKQLSTWHKKLFKGFYIWKFQV
jgi:hypothetical protein